MAARRVLRSRIFTGTTFPETDTAVGTQAKQDCVGKRPPHALAPYEPAFEESGARTNGCSRETDGMHAVSPTRKLLLCKIWATGSSPTRRDLMIKLQSHRQRGPISMIFQQIVEVLPEEIW